MSALEVNKIVGAVLAALLLFLGIRFVGELIFYGPEGPEGGEEHAEQAYPVGGGGAGDALADEGDGEPEAEAPSLATLLAAADAGAGQKLTKKCAACHSFESGGKAKIGPNLWGIVGAAKGASAGFSYSDGLTALGGTWSFEDLDTFLTSPKSFVPGTKMAFPGFKNPAERADVIAYLRGQSDSPLPLPEAKAETSGDGSVEESVAAAAEAAGEALDLAAEAAGQMAEKAGEAASDMADQAAGKADEIAEKAAEMVGQAGDMAGEVADQVVAAVDAATSPLIARIAGADLGVGEKEIKKCAVCHNFDEGGKAKIGPNLWDVVGAPKARAEGFRYSTAVAGLGGTWTYEDLNTFLTSPKAFAPGTKMAFPGVRDEGKRAAVIAYLRSLSNAPVPLP